ncbi:MAG TPA: [FeFe] hydrogenase, group A [Thermotogota bacterium]|nr:[FeFe] hydrogenase, group A [Thermotogota bacterium]
MNTFNIIIDNMEVPYEGEKNLLEMIRKANIDLPTFCYHSEISVYGACRMCMVEVNGKSTVPACSTPVSEGMVVKTNTKQLRNLRKMIVELMLASHNQSCTTCAKSNDCQLQEIAKQLGVDKVRFKQKVDFEPVDYTSDAIVRDPSKCILCGDCVRVCKEIQSVGVLDFANRGADSKIVACFNKGMGEIECVNCGQCVKACPVGALTIKSQVERVWDALHDESKTVVVQIAPAIRVAMGEAFGFQPGTTTTGQIVSALRIMGFDKIFDTSFGADFTVIEEGNEFIDRYQKGIRLPQFTSCCPAWVKFAEQYYPDLLTNLSSCKSPQQMFGSLSKEILTKELGISRENLVVVSIMPCTAKKFEAKRKEFSKDNNPDVDFVLTTQEAARMVKESGINFSQLQPGSFDMPFGFKTGAGVIFGTSGGVSEAVLRYAAAKLTNDTEAEFTQFRGDKGVKIGEVKVGDITLKMAVVSGLANARELIDKVRAGKVHFDLIEVMACPGGCVNGGGQPVSSNRNSIKDRSKGLYDNDKMLQLHCSNENPYLQKMYAQDLNPHNIHEWLHTSYVNRKRIQHEDVPLSEDGQDKPLKINICFGTSCYVRGAQTLYNQLMVYLKEQGLMDQTTISASFCMEKCERGPVLKVNGTVLEHCTIEKAIEAISNVTCSIS